MIVPPAGHAEHPPAESIAQLRATIGRLGRRLRATPAGSGLSPSEISVLATVARRGPLRLLQLAQMEGLNPTMLSRIAARLTAEGLVRRAPDPQDRRAARLAISESGRQLHRRIRAERDRALAQRLAELPEGQRSSVLQALPALEALAQALGQDRV